jgi:DNA-binding CsgD family transcriptional regulator/tetratricopeptide (TPR) repeat protein
VESRLYERTAELEAIDDVVAALELGRGNALLIEARAGLGKSALVEYAVETARQRGARILLARARHLESAAPFEVLRRLLGPAVEEAGGADSLTGAARFAAPLFTPGAELAQGVDYGCQWLVAFLAEQSPLVLAVDDAHWADAASLRVLLEVQAEISVMPVLQLLASRPVENPDAQRRLATMAAQPECIVLTPAALSRDGVESVVTETLGDPAHELFVNDCLLVSDGNAFYLHELLRPYRTDFRPDLRSIVSEGTISLRRTMSWRLSELGADATTMAQAAAVLGDGSALPVVAALVEIDEGVCVAEVARLEAASVLRHGDPIEFMHPLIRAAVEETLTEVEVGDLHARAARLLRSLNAAPNALVQHLVAAPGSGDPDVSAFLLDQGLAALATGSVMVAAQLLRRALAEPAPVHTQPQILIALGRAEHAQGDLDSARMHLGAAMEVGDRRVVLEAAAELFNVLLDADPDAELGRLHERVLQLDPRGDSPTEVRLRAQLLIDVFMAVEPGLQLPVELAEIHADDLSVARDIDRYLVVLAAIYERTMQSGSTEQLVANLRRAMSAGPDDPEDLTQWDIHGALAAATFLADYDLDAADAVLDRLAPAAARLAGVLPEAQAEINHRRIMHGLFRGEFEDVLAEISTAEAFTSRRHLVGYDGNHRVARGRLALELGDYATAAEQLSERIGEDLVYPALGALLSGDATRAIEILDQLELSCEVRAPVEHIEAELQPHLVASHAFELLGDRERAAAEAWREVDIRRRYGPQVRLADALRRAASFVPAREGVGLLEEAVTLAEGTPCRPVLARVLASYGAVLGRTGDEAAARDQLYRATDLASEMGMVRVRRRAQESLALAGGRPRRLRLRGPDSLTASQRQVASLATQGLTNRQIAERLFVTIKTVETHLMAVYRKLEIRGRDELSEALPATAPTRSPATTP